MFKKFIIFLLMLAALVVAALFIFLSLEKYRDHDVLADNEATRSNTNIVKPDSNVNAVVTEVEPIVVTEPILTTITLTVPYVNEAPDDNWTGPWKNACEEASMAMVEKYYLGQSTVTVAAAKSFMISMFNRQNKLWGSNADTDAARTAQLIDDYTVYNAVIKDNPTVENIKKELQQKRPVISLHYGFDLQNENIPFVPAPRGSSYHMMVIIGYDDTTQEFITNDTGDRVAGIKHRYGYKLFLNSLHDFIYAERQASGPARVIFTYPKLVKLVDSPRVYFLHDNIQQYVTSPAVFTAKGWSWEAVNVVEKEWLDSFKMGSDI